MSGRHSRHAHRSSKKYKEDSTRSKSRNNSYQKDDTKCHHSKTPPLPSKNNEMEDLLRRRQTLQYELEKLEKNSNKGSNCKIKESKKRKHTEDTDRKSSRQHRETIPRKDSRTKERSPDYKDVHIDSEDEENIIEQRRQLRKELLEKFNVSESKVNIDNEPMETQDESLCEPLKATLEKIPSKALTINETKDTTATDMFSDKDDFVHQNTIQNVTKDESKSQLTDNWDDADGYYIIRSGDVLNKRYTLKDILGQGVFANVVRAQDNLQANAPVAIKIVRNNDLMYRTSLKEILILSQINQADPENKCHCVHFITHFMHGGHLCLVLEPLHMDMRAVLKKYGKHHGLHMKALMSYSRQLLLALRLLRKIGIVHADIKPDNILVNEKKNVLKLCDFGSAAKLDEGEPTPYLVSRFYRAPEIILGVPYNHGIDIWSAACTFYEMATSKILFTGASNNRMLKCFMDLKGKIPNKLIRKGKFKDQHFNYNNNFLLHKKDEFSSRDKVVEIFNTTVNRDLYKELHKSGKNFTNGEEKKIIQLKDLLERMLVLDSNQRYTVSDCLRHSFIHEQFEK